MPAQLLHLRPTTTLAERALLCGDPARCLNLATALLDRPLMFNHARGLWGYTGTAADGAPLTIQSTGLGAASAAVITGELFTLGLRTAIRVGTARGLPGTDAPAAGAALTVAGAIAADGPSQALGAAGSVAPDAALTAGLTAAGVPAALVASTDLLQPTDAQVAAWRDAGAAAVDLQTATVLQVAARHGVPAAAILVITGATGDAPGALDDDAQLAAVRAAAQAAAAALGIPAREGAPLPPPRDDERPDDEQPAGRAPVPA